jgi:hypothetical protein
MTAVSAKYRSMTSNAVSAGPCQLFQKLKLTEQTPEIVRLGAYIDSTKIELI